MAVKFISKEQLRKETQIAIGIKNKSTFSKLNFAERNILKIYEKRMKKNKKHTAGK